MPTSAAHPCLGLTIKMGGIPRPYKIFGSVFGENTSTRGLLRLNTNVDHERQLVQSQTNQ